MSEQLYIYRWNRMGRKGQRCSVLARGSMNSCAIRFEDGYKAVTSRNALRKFSGDRPCASVKNPDAKRLSEGEIASVRRNAAAPTITKNAAHSATLSARARRSAQPAG